MNNESITEYQTRICQRTYVAAAVKRRENFDKTTIKIPKNLHRFTMLCNMRNNRKRHRECIIKSGRIVEEKSLSGISIWSRHLSDPLHFTCASTMGSIKVGLVVSAVLVIQVCSQRYNSNYQQDQRQANNFVRNAPQVPHSSASCPDKNGRYPTRTCDGYIECVDGVAEEKTCPDGLLFNPAAGVFAFPCQYPIDVDCSGREQTQPPQATEDCPHQFGYYLMGDSRNCGQFKNCVDGRAFVFDCPEGLAFNGETYRCDWPDTVATCDSEAFLGFSCPPDAKSFGLGQEETRFFRSPRDCQRYFICIDSKPRLYNCGEGRAFNDLINACDGIENVTGCAVPEYQNKATQRLY